MAHNFLRFLFLIFLIANINLNADEHIQTQNIINLSNYEAYQLIRNNINNENFVILDVRTNQEYLTSYISGAVNLDFYAEDFLLHLSKLDKSKIYLVYCRSGRRSLLTVQMMLEDDLGFESVYNLKNGIRSWKENGYPVSTKI